MKGALLEAWKCITDDVENYFVAPIIESFQAAWNGIKEAWNSVTSWFGEKWDGICEVFAYVKEWFGEKFTSAWVGIKSAFSTVGEFFGEVWTAVRSPFLKVSDWFKNTFQEAWEGVKSVFSEDGEIFSGIKEGISETFFTVVNGLIDGINWVIAKPFEAINDAIGWIKDIEILDWQPFSGLSRIDIPQIPKLATGTVVPANYGEFLAVLGDNKRETEVVSPLSTIKQAVREAMGEAGGGAKQPAVLKLIVKGKELAEVLIEDINDLTSSSGECPIKI